MLDISLRPELPGKAIVYLDGHDARLFKRLVKLLGSEERAQNAIILTGALADSPKETLTSEDTREVLDSFKDLVGFDYEEFQKLVREL